MSHLRLAVALTLGTLLGCSADVDPGDEAQSEADTVTVRADGYFTLTRDARRCAAPACGGYTLAPVNAAGMRCADGTTGARCYVAELDLSAVALTDAQRSSIASARGEVIAFGRVAAASGHRYGQFIAAEAWRSATGAAPTQSVVRVSTAGTSCAFLPCDPLNLQRANSGARPLSVAGVDLSAVTGLDPASRDALLGDATRDDGALLAGVRSSRAGALETYGQPYLRATQGFVPLRATATTGLCGADLQATLARATERMLYTSETDAPFTWFAPAGRRSVPTDGSFLSWIGLPRSTRVERVDVERALRGPLSNFDQTLGGEHTAARTRLLIEALQGNLRDLTVIRVGEVSVRVFFVGVTRCGELAGLETLAVET